MRPDVLWQAEKSREERSGYQVESGMEEVECFCRREVEVDQWKMDRGVFDQCCAGGSGAESGGRVCRGTACFVVVCLSSVFSIFRNRLEPVVVFARYRRGGS